MAVKPRKGVGAVADVSQPEIRHHTPNMGGGGAAGYTHFTHLRFMTTGIRIRIIIINK